MKNEQIILSGKNEVQAMKIHICDKCRNEIKPYNPDDKEGTAYIGDNYGGTYKIELCKNCQKDFIKWLKEGGKQCQ